MILCVDKDNLSKSDKNSIYMFRMKPNNNNHKLD